VLRERSQLTREIDFLHSKLIRLIESDRCFVCGSRDAPTCGHLFGRGRRNTRWDIEPAGNCHVQCANCNAYHSDVGMGPYIEVFIKANGADAFDALRLRANTSHHYFDHELRELRDRFAYELKARQ